MKKALLISLLLGPLLSLNLYAVQLHKCFLLPITDSIEGTIGNALFKRIELNLRSSTWCEYQEKPGLHKILKKYKRKLSLALQNSDVIRLVGKKSGAGSIIRVKLKYSHNSITLNTDVIDSMGKEYLFRHTIEMKSDAINNMSSTVVEQLNEYGSTLPYQFLITDMMGQDLIGKIISTNTFVEGDIVLVERPVSPIRHPLLKKVVEWETNKIAEATVVRINPPYLRVHIKDKPKLGPKIGDWGALIRPGESIKNKNVKKTYAKRYADIFEFEGTAIISRPYAHSNLDGTSEDLENKFLLGGRGIGHLIITKNIWAELGINHSIGLTGGLNTSAHNHLDFKTGYKFYLLKNTPGSFISPFLSYNSDTFDYNLSGNSQFIPTTFTGLAFGVYGNHPIVQKYDLTFRLSIGASTKVQIEGGSYGSSTSSSTSSLDIGVRHDYNREYDIYGGFNYSKFSAKFGNDELNYASFNLIGGIVYIY